jgi:hypothetical protein
MSSTRIAYPNETEPEEVSNNEIQSNGRKLCLVNGLPEVGVEVNDIIVIYPVNIIVIYPRLDTFLCP